MMDELRLLRGGSFVINDKFEIFHPTIGQICDYGEEKYFNMVKYLCATASDGKVFLNDVLHIDFTTVPDFEMFKMTCGQFSNEDTRILFGDSVDFSNMYLVYDPTINERVLECSETGLRVDESIYILMVDYLRRLHMLERHVDNPGNEYTKKWMIDKARKMQRRNANKPYESALAPLISAMVNCEQFKYKHDEVWDLPLYAFMDSVRRIQKIKNFDQTMSGIFAGTVDSKKISMESLNWLGALD